MKIDRDSKSAAKSQPDNSQCAASPQDVSGEPHIDDPNHQVWWMENVYKPALRKAVDGDWIDFALLVGNSRELNREQERDEKDGDANQ